MVPGFCFKAIDDPNHSKGFQKTSIAYFAQVDGVPAEIFQKLCHMFFAVASLPHINRSGEPTTLQRSSARRGRWWKCAAADKRPVADGGR